MRDGSLGHSHGPFPFVPSVERLLAVGPWGDGSWRVKREKAWSLGKWARTGSWWAVGRGRERTGAVGKPVGLSGRCVSTGSVKAESDLLVVVTGTLLKPDSRPLGLCTAKMVRNAKGTEVRRGHRSLDTSTGGE